MKIILSLLVSVTIFCFAVEDISAQEIKTDSYSEADSYSELKENLELDELFNILPDETKESLKQLGINNVSANTLAQAEYSSIFEVITNSAVTQSNKVFTSMGIIVAVLLLYSLSEGFLQSLTTDSMREVLSVVCTLCISCALVIPVTDVIDAANVAIKVASDFMLAFVPIIVTVLVSCGKTLSSSGYYSLMIFSAEGIAQLSSKLITPMLNVFLGVSVCGTIVPQLRIDSLTELFSKTIKWILSFSFTVFSALLTFKTLITTSIDSVSTRAVRFTMSSFIPVVGAALSEAYKTVQGSVNILKNGIGVFVILAVALVFLPIVLRLMLWTFSISMCKTIAQILNISIPVRLLQSVSTVLSVLLAVVLCVMALYIISTALIITAGGNSG